MAKPATLYLGRDAFDRKAWADAHAELSAADREEPLEPEDLERLATSARLIGRDPESADFWARAYQEFEDRGDTERAVRCGFWLAMQFLLAGEKAQAGGWVSRARRLLDDARRDCVERGYLLLPAAVRSAFEGDSAGAYAAFTEVAAFGARFRDRDLLTLARHGQGRTLIRLGEASQGLALLDEVMVAVTAGEVAPIIVGDVYCSVIEACYETFDLRRAHEWTAALTCWCASQPDLVPYRGMCLVRRAEILQLHGEWGEALDEAERAREWLSRPPAHRAVGTAFYQLAELHRVRGEFAEAEEAYRQGNQWGRDPQPGLALLRLAQGQVDAAVAAVRRVLDEARDRSTRSRLLGACIEIMLAAGDLPAARSAADELSGIAAELAAPLLRAMAAQGSAGVLLAEGRPQEALAALRTASVGWRELEVPYEGARVRVLIGLAHRALGDTDTATMELDAAGHLLRSLGAAPDLGRLEALSRLPAAKGAAGLTAREVQVLGLVATGKTNRAIAARLGISEKTVARHLSNIFTKLGLSTRAAATAYAYEHDLI